MHLWSHLLISSHNYLPARMELMLIALAEHNKPSTNWAFSIRMDWTHSAKTTTNKLKNIKLSSLSLRTKFQLWIILWFHAQPQNRKPMHKILKPRTTNLQMLKPTSHTSKANLQLKMKAGTRESKPMNSWSQNTTVNSQLFFRPKTCSEIPTQDAVDFFLFNIMNDYIY